MKCMKAVVPRAVCGLPIAEAVPAQATEGGIGRPITGMEVTPYAAVVPNARITFDPAASTSTTTFNSATNTWETTVPAGLAGNVFASGLPFVVPAAGFPGGINPIVSHARWPRPMDLPCPSGAQRPWFVPIGRIGTRGLRQRALRRPTLPQFTRTSTASS